VLALVLVAATGGQARAQEASPARGAAPAGKARGAAPAGADQPVAVIDLAPGDAAARRTRRAELEEALAGIQGITAIDDAALRAALAGERQSAQADAGRVSLAAAAAAFGAPNCPGARSAADTAVLELAAAQASGAEVTAELRQAHVYLLLCADQAGDTAAAQRAAAALRALGAPEPPAGVPDAVWSRYPALDATGGQRRFQLDITSQPDGAAIWIDHAPAGKAPHTALLPEGEHLVAAAAGGAAIARRVTLSTWTTQLALALPAATAPWADIERQVRGWRTGATRRTAPALGRVLARAGVRYAVVIGERGGLEVWQRSDRGTLARPLGGAKSALEVGALVGDAERGRRRGPGIDPDVPLLRETQEERAARREAREGPSAEEWWVYAAIVGAVAVGAGIVLINDLGDDRQRIEVTFP